MFLLHYKLPGILMSKMNECVHILDLTWPLPSHAIDKQEPQLDEVYDVWFILSQLGLAGPTRRTSQKMDDWSHTANPNISIALDIVTAQGESLHLHIFQRQCHIWGSCNQQQQSSLKTRAAEAGARVDVATGYWWRTLVVYDTCSLSSWWLSSSCHAIIFVPVQINVRNVKTNFHLSPLLIF